MRSTELLPDLAAGAGPGISIERDFETALRQSQVVMMLRIQAERLAGVQLDLEQYKDSYQLTGQRLASTMLRRRWCCTRARSFAASNYGRRRGRRAVRHSRTGPSRRRYPHGRSGTCTDRGRQDGGRA